MKRQSAAFLAITVVALFALLLVPATFAAKGGGGGGGGKPGGGGGKPGGGSSTGSLTLVMVSDQNANGSPNWNDTVTFTVSTTNAYPYVSVRCYKGTTLVYAADAGFYASYPWPGSQMMPLYSPSWTSGAADCTTTLDGSPSLSFHVDA
jgi:hypothetical protein